MQSSSAGQHCCCRARAPGLLIPASGIENDADGRSRGRLYVAVDQEPLPIRRHVIAENVAGGYSGAGEALEERFRCPGGQTAFTVKRYGDELPLEVHVEDLFA